MRVPAAVAVVEAATMLPAASAKIANEANKRFFIMYYSCRVLG